VAPTLGCSIAGLERASAILLVGSDVRREVPIIAHRIRKGAVRMGTKVAFVNPRPVDVRFPVQASLTSNGLGMAQHLAAILARHYARVAAPHRLGWPRRWRVSAPTPDHERVATMLSQGELRLVLLGALAERHASFAEIRALAAALAEVTGARLGYLPEGANAVGASLAGATPHRGVGGRPVAQPGSPRPT